MDKMTEKQVMEIALAKDLSRYTIQQCKESDRWIEEYALTNLHHHSLSNKRALKIFRRFAEDMAKCHYGSVEVDQLLKALKCYPEWLGERR